MRSEVDYFNSKPPYSNFSSSSGGDSGVEASICCQSRSGFSNDKSPYKNHLGAYIAAHGKKALHGGY